MSGSTASQGQLQRDPAPQEGDGAPTREIQALVVDDDPQMRLTVAAALEGHGFSIVFADRAEIGLDIASRQRFEVLLLDVNMPGISGLEMLSRLREYADPPETVVLTGRPQAEGAVEAMKLGAFDYLSKPFDGLKLVATLKNAATKYRLSRENTTLRQVVEQRDPTWRGPIVAESPEMQRILRVVDRVALSDASVLIQGETGVGKGLIAKLIHSASPRASEAQMHINCSALNETLLESELFGYEKGAFTGANEAKPGLFQVADGGTLFLDEVAEMSPAMQAKLLLTLDSGELRRVGGTSVINVDVRIIAATNKDLEEEVRAGRFREDLLFRLNVVKLELPPLRRRAEDIEGLVGLYLQRHRLAGQPIKSMSADALEALRTYSWPGNVRELANVVEGMVLMAAGDELEIADLPVSIRGSDATEPTVLMESDSEPEPPSLAEVEHRHIARVLSYTKGKKAPAARLLGIDVKTLYSKIKRYDIEV